MTPPGPLRAGLLAAALAAAALAAAAPAGSDGAGVQLLARSVAGARGGVDAELGTLTGGPLSQALADAARSGRPLRLLLDPSQAATRAQGVLLASLTPCAQVRWSVAGAFTRRWMALGRAGQWTWYAGDRPRPLTSTAWVDRFESAWSVARRGLPDAVRLTDALEALPDPSETSPHYVRRRSGGAP